MEKPSIGIHTFKTSKTKRTDSTYLFRNLKMSGAKMKHTNKSRTNHSGPSIGAALCIGTPKIFVTKVMLSPNLPLFHNINPQPLSEQKFQTDSILCLDANNISIKKAAVSIFHKIYGMKTEPIVSTQFWAYHHFKALFQCL